MPRSDVRDPTETPRIPHTPTTGRACQRATWQRLNKLSRIFREFLGHMCNCQRQKLDSEIPVHFNPPKNQKKPPRTNAEALSKSNSLHPTTEAAKPQVTAFPSSQGISVSSNGLLNSRPRKPSLGLCKHSK